MSNLQVDDPIALRQAVPEHKLVEDQIGCIQKIFSPDEFEVEFGDGGGDTIAILRLNLQQVRLLRDEITLTEQEFWKLIENAKADSNGDGIRQVEILIDHFAQRSIPDIFELDRIFHKFLQMAHRNSLIAACFMINAGCTDDIFMDFRGWLIAQGEEVFHDAVRDPESLVDVVEVKKENRGFDAVLDYILSVASRAYEKKTGQENLRFCSGSAFVAPSGWLDVEWDEDTVNEQYPKLAAKFHYR